MQNENKDEQKPAQEQQINPQQQADIMSVFAQVLNRMAQKPCKLVFLVRTDLNMGVGKMCAQCGHAVSAALEENNPKIKIWKQIGEKKVALKVTYQELQNSLKAAEEAKLPCGYICDAGHTQVDPGTTTVGWIGPWEEDTINLITGKFKLL